MVHVEGVQGHVKGYIWGFGLNSEMVSLNPEPCAKKQGCLRAGGDVRQIGFRASVLG